MTVPSWAPCTSTTAPRGSAAPASSALTEVNADSTGLRPALRSGSRFHWFLLDWSSLPCSSWRVLAEAPGGQSSRSPMQVQLAVNSLPPLRSTGGRQGCGHAPAGPGWKGSLVAAF